MVETAVLQAEKREETGTGAARRLRARGRVPAVLYGHGRQPLHLHLDSHEVNVLLAHHVGETMVVELRVKGDNTPVRALIKEIQHDPLTDRVIHLDLQEVRKDERVRVTVPIELVGEAAGVKEQGGVLEQLLHEVEFECLPDDVVEFVEADVSGLEVGDHLTVADLPLPADRYRIIGDREAVVATVVPPRVAEAEAEAVPAEEAAPAAEPEVISEKKAEKRAAGEQETE